MGLLQEFQNLITEHGGSSILRKRIALFKDKLSQLEKQCGDLQKALGNLHIENADLRKQIEEARASVEYTEHRGAFFKRKSSGGNHPTVQCPFCRYPIGSIGEFTKRM